jgi:DNA-binding transcriptional MerR regulator
MAEKSDAAFRTISEAADALGLPQHVLRFWETRFPQLQPLKRAGGRRYYRPADMALLHRIRTLLHDQGMTIRGAQLALAGKGAATAAQPPVTAGQAPDTAAGMPDSAAPAFPGLALHAGLPRAAVRAIRDRLAAALSA